MARAKRGFKRRKRVNKIRKLAEGFVLGRRNQFRRTTEAVTRAHQHAYMGRKVRKRDFRALWISRLSAAVRAYDLSYSRFIAALKKSNVLLDRKVLADLAVADPSSFKAIVEKVRAAAPTI